MFRITSRGSFAKTESFLARMSRGEIFNTLDAHGRRGVDALARATPRDSGLTASSWTYKVIRGRRGPTIVWDNTNLADGTPVVILIQYGHGTGTGGWVEGRDFINPAIQPIFDQIANDVWEKVKHG